MKKGKGFGGMDPVAPLEPEVRSPSDSEMLTWLIETGSYGLLDYAAYYHCANGLLQHMVRAEIARRMKEPQ